MCGRYILAQKLEIIEKRFEVTASKDFSLKPAFNISPGQYAPVITNRNPREIQQFMFGMTPFWAKKPMYLFNARTEGSRNKDNDHEYKGARDIINKPAFRKPIRSQRCLVIADAFIEGTTKEGLSKPYVVHLRDKQRPFAFAGIWDTWQNNNTGEEINSFAIITTVSNSLLRRLPHHRSPVILPRKYEKMWLKESTVLSDITSVLEPYDSNQMNAYPILPAIKNPHADGRELIEPVGQPVVTEYEYKKRTFIELQGMGGGKKRFKDIES